MNLISVFIYGVFLTPNARPVFPEGAGLQNRIRVWMLLEN